MFISGCHICISCPFFVPLALDGFDRSSGGVVVKISRGEDVLEEAPGINSVSRDDDGTAAGGNNGELQEPISTKVSNFSRCGACVRALLT